MRRAITTSTNIPTRACSRFDSIGFLYESRPVIRAGPLRRGEYITSPAFRQTYRRCGGISPVSICR